MLTRMCSHSSEPSAEGSWSSSSSHIPACSSSPVGLSPAASCLLPLVTEGLPPPGPTTQATEKTTEMYDRELTHIRGPNHVKMNTHAAPSCSKCPCPQNRAGLRARFKDAINIPEKDCEMKCESGSLSVRDAFTTRAKCQQLVVQHKNEGLPYTGDSVFCNTTGTTRVRRSKSESARRVGLRFAPLWRSLDDCLRICFPDDDNIVLSIDSRSETLSIADKKNRVILPVFKFAPIGDEHLCTVVQRWLSRVFRWIYWKALLAASDDATRSLDVVL